MDAERNALVSRRWGAKPAARLRMDNGIHPKCCILGVEFFQVVQQCLSTG